MNELFSPHTPSFAASGPVVSAGTVGPLSLGEGEVAYTLAPGGVENLDVTASAEIRGLMCHPASITSFKSDHCCVTVLPSGSHAVNIRGFAKDGALEDYHMPAGPAKTSGVTGVVAMAEVSVTDLHCAHFDIY